MTRKILREATHVRVCAAVTCVVGYVLLQGVVCKLLMVRGQLGLTVRSLSPFALHRATAVAEVMHAATASRGLSSKNTI